MKAIVTGANRGIGYSILRTLAASGWNVIAVCRIKSDDFERKVRDLSIKYNVELCIYELDLFDEESIKKFAQYLVASKTEIDALINNAGIATGATLMMTSVETLKQIFQVNYYAPVLLTQYIVKWMIRKNKQGSVVNIGSVAALDAMDGFTAYGSSKAALMHASKIWAKELSTYGIRINCIAPSSINTEMASQMDEKTKRVLEEKCFMHRMGEVDEVASLVLFLISEQSSFINGQIIRIDGGM